MSADATRPKRVDGLVGTVAQGPFGQGSKSERQAMWLETPDGRYELRRKGGPAFGDRALDAYLGRRVRCDGFLLGHTLLAERIEPVP